MPKGDEGDVLIVAGGTGGHIFPALVFGRWIAEHRGLSVSYLCGSRPIEAEIYASMGATPHRLSIDGSPLGTRSPVKILRRIGAMLLAFRETARCLFETRPRAVFLFGGYVSLVPLLLCRLRGIPIVVHEQNALAGRVTRLASWLGASVVTGWEECGGLRGPHVAVGIPVRWPERIPREEALARLGLPIPDGARIVGVATGSLGSSALMAELIGAAGELRARDPSIELLILGDASVGDKEGIWPVGRQWDMRPFYSLCDVLVCRAGGSTLAEALSWRIPAVAVPWGGAADGHQERNALSFVAAGGGAMWREGEGRDALVDAIGDLLGRRASLDLEGASGEDVCLAIARAVGL